MSNEIFDTYGRDPIALFQNWLDEAAPLEPNDPEAICLATADSEGTPSARMVLLKDISQRGFKFHTSENSAKGSDIKENQNVSFCIYWKSTRKQIRVVGIAKPVSDAESDEYFLTRPRARAVGAWASDQSQPYEGADTLAQQVAKYEEKYEGVDPVPRPPYWKGFVIEPTSIEFWIGNKDRLHTRFIYKRNEDAWDTTWLYP